MYVQSALIFLTVEQLTFLKTNTYTCYSYESIFVSNSEVANFVAICKYEKFQRHAVGVEAAHFLRI